jgi:hypothetical protein
MLSMMMQAKRIRDAAKVAGLNGDDPFSRFSREVATGVEMMGAVNRGGQRYSRFPWEWALAGLGVVVVLLGLAFAAGGFAGYLWRERAMKTECLGHVQDFGGGQTCWFWVKPPKVPK